MLVPRRRPSRHPFQACRVLSHFLSRPISRIQVYCVSSYLLPHAFLNFTSSQLSAHSLGHIEIRSTALFLSEKTRIVAEGLPAAPPLTAEQLNFAPSACC